MKLHRSLSSRGLKLTALVAVAALTACSGPYLLSSEVSSFGNWPASRKPGSFYFERLPSQQQAGAVAESQTRLEEGARAALIKAGFTPAADAQSADILVALGARIDAHDVYPWMDARGWGWHGSYASWRYGGFYGGGRFGSPYHAGLSPRRYDFYDHRYDRSVGLLLRDRMTAEPLYEARSSNEGMTQGDTRLVGALFESAMSDFPNARPEPHSVAVQVQR